MRSSKPRILLLYKNSTYAGYFLSSQQRFSKLRGLFNSEEIKRFKKTHESHFWALSYVEAVLKHKGLKYTKACRGSSLDYRKYDLIITFGGDGTFLEAARNVRSQMIWGVNSDPQWSVGRFCSGNPKNFEPMLDSILSGKAKTKTFHRLRLSFNTSEHSIEVLNDVLLCHQNPGALSRYNLKIGTKKEEQKSSGVWIATAAGSTGGIYSAGGKRMPDHLSGFQYRARELYIGSGKTYRMKGEILKASQQVMITSLMREGVAFVDGSHVCLPFSFGTTVKIIKSPHPLKVIWS